MDQLATPADITAKSGIGYRHEVAGVLLYAKTDETETPDADMTIGGNRISLKTIGLDLEWEAISHQLDNLC